MTKLPLNVQEMSVSQLLAVIEQLAAENAQLRAALEELKRSSARSAAPFSKNQRKKNPKRPGRKAGQGTFRYRAAPTEEQYTAPLEEVPVTETACPASIPNLFSEILDDSYIIYLGSIPYFFDCLKNTGETPLLVSIFAITPLDSSNL